ncbi:Kynurenine formamidase [Orchesella cincta]|uniref:Kynurenine formamidase n=1 Tax=Orchesella cincta TaxID=48709 RepID=A0A1D2NHF6_ORCCI|nr:Kynurenine formamidase [Orchesella cincta]
MFRICRSSLRIPLVFLLLPAFTLSDFFNGGSSNTVEETEWFDLSYPLDEDTVFFPGQMYEQFNLTQDIKGFNQTSSGNFPFWYATFSFCMSEHGGTHVDAPYHFNKLGWKLGEIPLKRMVDVPATIIDVERDVFVLKHPDEFALEVKHVLEHEAKFGQILTGSVILVRTGLSGAAADWLVRERHIYGIGIDAPGLDIGNNKGNPVAHIVTLGAQVYNIENVANLDYLIKKTRKQTPFGGTLSNCNLRLFVLPSRLSGTGGPARVLAHCKPGFASTGVPAMPLNPNQFGQF